MHRRLAGIDAKIDRAHEALATQNTESSAWLKANPLPTGGHFDPNTGWHVESFMQFPQPPVRFSVLIGDYVHNLRSALDHLAWQLISKFGTGKPRGKTGFPIYKVEDDFICHVRRPGRQGKPSLLRGLPVDSAAWALIEGAQPYKGSDPASHPLSVIRAFNNMDKHRTLATSYVQVYAPPDLRSMFVWPDTTGEPIVQEFHLRPGDRLVENAKIASLRFPRPGPFDSGVVMKGQVEVAIEFSDGKGGTAGQTLADLGAFVEALVNDARLL